MKRILLACLSLIICAGCKNDLDDQDPLYKKSTWNPTISKFSNCGEIDQYLLEHQMQQGDSVSISTSTGSSKPEQTYDNQVEGVLEGDILQVSSKYFYFARPSAIEIIRREDFSLFKSIPVVYASTRRLLVSDDKIVFVSGDYSRTTVQVFDVKSDFKQTYNNTFLGWLHDFRKVENKLQIVTQYSYQSGRSSTDCAQIYRPNQEDGDAVVTFAHQVDLASAPYSAVSAGFMGYSDFIHVTENELILFKNGSRLPSHFRVVKFGADRPVLEQVQTYDGRIKDRWSVLAKDDKIIFASTSRFSKIFAYEKMRGLQYELASESIGFAAGEEIRAVRYLMDKAYIVTYQQMDPLFIFDIKDTRNMKLLGFLESPGFSTQLRELSGGILFGLGHAEGFKSFKVSLFDVIDPLQPRETQTLIWGESKQSSSYSEALTEPKALFISQEKNRIMFPATIMDDYGMNHIMPFMGALILDYRDRKVQEAGRITHLSLNNENCRNDIQRVFESRGEIYSFSRYGAMRSSAENFKTLSELPFKNSQMMECEHF